MKIRIVNTDGIPYNTHIYDAETGKEIDKVTEITFSPIKVRDNGITAQVLVLVDQIDMVADAQVNTYCPYCQQVLPVEEVKEEPYNENYHGDEELEELKAQGIFDDDYPGS